MKARTLILIVLSFGMSGAHDIITTKITWSTEISRLVYKRCATCHHDGGSSFSLMTYEAARPWAKAIKEEVLERRMPPWEAVKGFGDFKDDRGLSGEELELISDWVEGGAPEGDPKYLPPQPKIEDWQDPAKPDGAAALVASSGIKLDAPASVVAVRVKQLPKGASIQAIATRPDGTIEPLLWIYKYNPDFTRTYYYKTTVNLPAGTQIQMSPAGAATLDLFTTAPKKLPQSTHGGF